MKTATLDGERPPYLECDRCKHFIKDRECKAFTKIPDTIWLDEVKHHTPVKGQKNDIVFEKK